MTVTHDQQVRERLTRAAAIDIQEWKTTMTTVNRRLPRVRNVTCTTCMCIIDACITVMHFILSNNWLFFLQHD